MLSTVRTVRIQGKKKLQTISSPETRPTTALVREALFNIWQFEMAGCRWLDLCAGSGAMGAEALCRGAAVVVGIEQASRACTVIEQNWRKVAQPNQQMQILRMDVRKGIEKLSGQQFDRIYFDPPYASDLYEPVLDAIACHQLLAATGILAVEHRRDRNILLAVNTLHISRTKHYGNTSLTFFTSNHPTEMGDAIEPAVN